MFGRMFRGQPMLDSYLNEILDNTSSPGSYAFRGQADSGWDLESSAVRRLKRSDRQVSAKDCIDYHRDIIGRARRDGFGVEHGKEATPLQLLAKLQHFGAATGLLDFTWSALVALWFASENPERDGKLFVLNTGKRSVVG